MTSWEVYLITQANDFKALMIAMSGAFTCYGVWLFLHSVDPLFGIPKEMARRWVKKARRSLALAFVAFFIATIIPSTKGLVAIYVVPRIVNNESVQKIPAKFLKLAEEWLEELRPEKEKK